MILERAGPDDGPYPRLPNPRRGAEGAAAVRAVGTRNWSRAAERTVRGPQTVGR